MFQHLIKKPSKLTNSYLICLPIVVTNSSIALIILLTRSYFLPDIYTFRLIIERKTTSYPVEYLSYSILPFTSIILFDIMPSLSRCISANQAVISSTRVNIIIFSQSNIQRYWNVTHTHKMKKHNAKKRKQNDNYWWEKKERVAWRINYIKLE